MVKPVLYEIRRINISAMLVTGRTVKRPINPLLFRGAGLPLFFLKGKKKIKKMWEKRENGEKRGRGRKNN